jgi:hypothetical protein
MSPTSSFGRAEKDFHACGTFGASYAPILCLDEHYLQMDSKELPLDTHHLGVPSGMPKMIFMLVVHSEQTMHLSCTESNTISKRTKTCFQLTYIT